MYVHVLVHTSSIQILSKTAQFGCAFDCIIGSDAFAMSAAVNVIGRMTGLEFIQGRSFFSLHTCVHVQCIHVYRYIHVYFCPGDHPL